MTRRHERGLHTNRRSVLRLSALATGMASVSAGAKGSTGGGTTAEGSVPLGTFESGTDGWNASGDEELARVSADDYPAAVRDGSHALAVEGTGSIPDVVANERRIARADVANHPYLELHVVGGVPDPATALDVEVRLHHDAGSPKTSETRRVARQRPRRLQWNLTEFGERALKTARKLEIAWEPAGGGIDAEADADGARERSTGGGAVFLDEIWLHDTAPMDASRRRQAVERRLNRTHGTVVERRFDERSATRERGTLVYADGTEVPFSVEFLAEGATRHTIDGQTFDIGGGSQ